MRACERSMSWLPIGCNELLVIMNLWLQGFDETGVTCNTIGSCDQLFHASCSRFEGERISPTEDDHSGWLVLVVSHTVSCIKRVIVYIMRW